jgi:hypothetical protein
MFKVLKVFQGKTMRFRSEKQGEWKVFEGGKVVRGFEW